MKDTNLLGGISAFTPIGQVMSSNPRTLFSQTDHSNMQQKRHDFGTETMFIHLEKPKSSSVLPTPGKTK